MKLRKTLGTFGHQIAEEEGERDKETLSWLNKT
jgi:hypothetical protein